MTKREFFKALKEGMKPTAAAVFEIRHIAGLLRIVYEDEWYCPLTFVCKHVTGVRYFIGDWEMAAAKLQLRVGVARQIINAADNSYTPGKLRQELAEACGWQEREGIHQ